MFRRINFPIFVSLCIVVVIAVLWWRNNSRLDDYFAHPKKGDIYILQSGDTFQPIKIVGIDDVKMDEISFVQYIFTFGEAVPDREQLLDAEWNQNFTAIYKRQEIDRLYSEGKIVEIYRD